jgi:predicted transcriptional regulator of viral defense system
MDADQCVACVVFDQFCGGIEDLQVAVNANYSGGQTIEQTG